MPKHALLLGLIGTALASPLAASTTYYRYDALGRLVQSLQDSSGWRSIYFLDSADNRSGMEMKNVLLTLQAGQSLTSPDGRFRLVMQGDGNLVVYGPSGPLWGSGTIGTGAQTAYMQWDGNLVIYASGGGPVWASNTGGH